MSEKVIRARPSLPPNYVSLAQLRDRWLRKQEEAKLKEKEEEEKRKLQEKEEDRKREADTQNENQNLGGLNNSKMEDPNVLLVSVEKDGREMAVIEERRKGKEILCGGLENGDKKKRNKRSSRNKKSAAKGKMGNEDEKGKRESEIKRGNEGVDGADRIAGVEINIKNEVKAGVSGVLTGESSRRMALYGDLEAIEETVSVNMVEVLPGNGVSEEISSVKKVGRRGGFRRYGDTRASGYRSKKEYRVKLHQPKEVELELFSEKVKDENCHGKKWQEKMQNGVSRETEYRVMESRAGIPVSEGCGHKVELKLKQEEEDEMLQIGSEADNLKGKDRDGLKESRAEIHGMKGGSEVELKSKKKVGDESSDVGDKLYGFKGRNKFLGQGNSCKSYTQEHRVEVKGLNDNSALPKKFEDEVLVAVESAKNGEKGDVEDGSRKHGNWRGVIDRKFEGLTVDDRKPGRMRSRVGVRVGDSRRNVRSGRFEGRQKMKRIESMVWVKKEVQSGVDAAEIGSSGTSTNQD